MPCCRSSLPPYSLPSRTRTHPLPSPLPAFLNGAGRILGGRRYSILPSRHSLYAHSLTLSSLNVDCAGRILGSRGCCVSVEGVGTKGRLEGCNIFGSQCDGVLIGWGARPVLAACK